MELKFNVDSYTKQHLQSSPRVSSVLSTPIFFHFHCHSISPIILKWVDVQFLFYYRFCLEVQIRSGIAEPEKQLKPRVALKVFRDCRTWRSNVHPGTSRSSSTNSSVAVLVKIRFVQLNHSLIGMRHKLHFYGIAKNVDSGCTLLLTLPPTVLPPAQPFCCSF